ncbi:scarecrow protein 8 [Spatholobus suberectus]|nr:scarecrow protein 8 [Spatholobus suberectus]
MVAPLKSLMNLVQNPPPVPELFGTEHAEWTRLPLESFVWFTWPGNQSTMEMENLIVEMKILGRRSCRLPLTQVHVVVIKDCYITPKVASSSGSAFEFLNQSSGFDPQFGIESQSEISLYPRGVDPVG